MKSQILSSERYKKKYQNLLFVDVIERVPQVELYGYAG